MIFVVSDLFFYPAKNKTNNYHLIIPLFALDMPFHLYIYIYNVSVAISETFDFLIRGGSLYIIDHFIS